MSVYLSVAPPDGFTKWGDADWERWLRDHPWEAAERVCSRGDWAIFLYQVRQHAAGAKRRLEPLLESLIHERPVAAQDADDLRSALQAARGELSQRPAAELKRTNGHFAGEGNLEAMIAAARARMGREPSMAEIWDDVFAQLEGVLAHAVKKQRGVYFGNV